MNPLSSKWRSLSLALFLSGVVMITAGSDVLAEHHMPGRHDPYGNNCTLCHGKELTGAMGRSCYACHDRLWPGGETPPVADPAGPDAGEVGQPVKFDGSGSFDVDGTIVSYAWDFGDGSTGSGQQPTHVYTRVGNYSVTLTVVDDSGNSDIALTEADIVGSSNNIPPLPVMDGPYTGTVGSVVSFDGSGSFDVDGTIVAYDWDFGDGNVGTGVTTTHVYVATGTYTVKLTVTDNGGASRSTESEATISSSGGGNSPPVVDAGGPYSGVVGEAVQFDASNTYDPDGDTLIYLWNFGDGSLPPMPGQDPTASHVYTAAGTYTAQVIVSDGSATPVVGEASVEITDGNGTDPPPTGDSWDVRLPLQQVQLIVTFQDVGGLLRVQTLHEDGSTSTGGGVQSGNFVVWVDASGAMFLGAVDTVAETMRGLMIDNTVGSTIWFAERL